MPGRRPEETAAAFGRACGEAGVGYALVGGLAVGAWGRPRATQDIDSLLDLPPGREAVLVGALRGGSFEVDPEAFAAARGDRGHVSVFDAKGPFHVDCKLAATDLERQQVREALEVALGAGRLRVVRAEETVAYKVKFGTPRDVEDAESILAVQGDRLDLGRLRAFAAGVGVTAEVEALLRRRGGR